MMGTATLHQFPKRRGADPLLDYMKRHGLPLTRETYLELDYPEGPPDPFPAELEEGLPPEVRGA